MQNIEMIPYDAEKINTILNLFPTEKHKYNKSLWETLDLLVGINKYVLC